MCHSIHLKKIFKKATYNLYLNGSYSECWSRERLYMLVCYFISYFVVDFVRGRTTVGVVFVKYDCRFLTHGQFVFVVPLYNGTSLPGTAQSCQGIYLPFIRKYCIAGVLLCSYTLIVIKRTVQNGVLIHPVDRPVLCRDWWSVILRVVADVVKSHAVCSEYRAVVLSMTARGIAFWVLLFFFTQG